MRRGAKKAFLFVNKGNGRLAVHGLKAVMKGGKAMIELPSGCKEVMPGDFVWDMKILGMEETLHVVLWKKAWNNDARNRRVFMFKFRPATLEEVVVEAVMNE